MGSRTLYTARREPALVAEENGVRMEKLNSGNYTIWKFKMKMSLIKEDVWDMVDSGLTSSPTAKEKKNDQKALEMICLSISDNQIIHVKDCETAKDAWNTLSEFYEKSTFVNKLFLRRRLMSKRLEAGGDLEEHVNDIIQMADQLKAAGEKFEDRDISNIILCSLPDSFEPLIIALESRDEEDLTLEFVKARLIHEVVKHRENGIFSKESNYNSIAMKAQFESNKFKIEQVLTMIENILLKDENAIIVEKKVTQRKIVE